MWLLYLNDTVLGIKYMKQIVRELEDQLPFWSKQYLYFLLFKAGNAFVTPLVNSMVSMVIPDHQLILLILPSIT